ncbi:uncharacterized protein LOC132896752 [Neoarius graeffei]|uniref:uncharacterized protein LOC132896752 n=1 Tax=Neoarius graeffei TaxID=443677 RepID=UPI00298CCABB|nr:uncharacterized protein LOC132896752 [Neoarius graeffei]
MAKLSAAEKQRRYRERRDADPQRRQEYLQKRKESYARDIDTGKRKRISELTERNKRVQRKEWRIRQQRCRERSRTNGQNRACCSCYCLQEVALVPLEEAISHLSNEFRPTVIGPHHCGQWCVVQYDNTPYPGIILQVEEGSVQVKCMHSNGVNMFYWPSPRDDVTWYEDGQIMCLIPEPLALNRRSVQIEKSSGSSSRNSCCNNINLYT